MNIKIIVEVNRGVVPTEEQLELLAKHVTWQRVGKQSATRKLYMCILDHMKVNKFLDFMTEIGMDPILRKANKQNGMRIGFKYDEEGNVVRDTSEPEMADDDISTAFPQIQRSYEKVLSFKTRMVDSGKVDENDDPIMVEEEYDHVTETILVRKKVRDSEGNVVMEDSGEVDEDSNPIMVPVTEPDMMDVKPPTYMGWA